ncbi:MAG: hypothetical protein ABR915_03835 [Thermoguttaceae bacterium]|jgi:hypothetical protein
MTHRLAYLAVTFGLASAGLILASPAAFGQEGAYLPPPNYYVGTGPCSGVAAALYPCPRPTPPLVGWTYITYQPLDPHEFLYTHRDHYKTWHCDGSVTRTKVCYGRSWQWPPSVMHGVPALCTPPARPGCPSE